MIIDGMTREFDGRLVQAQDASAGAIAAIADLQQIQQRVISYDAPTCLTDLHQYQVDYVNTALSTLQAFLASGNTVAVHDGLAQALEYHDRYNAEAARVLGETPPPPLSNSVPLIFAGTPTANMTPAP